MILVCSITVAAILCQLPATSNPKTVGGMCYAIFRSDRVNTLSQCKIIISNQSQPSLQWIHLNKHQSAIANHRPGKPDMLSQHAKAKSDQLSQQKSLHIRGCKSPKQQTSCGSHKN